MTNNLCVASTEQASGLEFVGCKVIVKELINVTQLFIFYLETALRHLEID